MSSNIAPLGPSLTSQARAAELNAANAARARIMNGELSDISELPSAQPVSLGDFAIRSQTNNKGSKSWKPFPQDERTNEQAAETVPGTGETFRRPQRPVDRYFPPNASPTPAYPAPQPHLLSPLAPHYNHGAYQIPDYQYPMYQGMSYYQQMYPGQMSYYPMMPAAPANYSTMQRTPSPVKSPSRRRQNRSRNRFTSHDTSPIKQKENIVRSKSPENGVDKKQDNEQQKKEPNLPDFSSDTLSKRIAPERKKPIHLTPEQISRDILRHQDPPSTPDQAICRPDQEIPAKDQPQTPQIDTLLSDNAEQTLHSPPSEQVSQCPSSHLKFSPNNTKTRAESFNLTTFLNDASKTSPRLEKDIFGLEDPFAPAQKNDISSRPQSPSHQSELPPVKPYVPLVNKYEKNLFASEESREKELAKISTETTWKEFLGGTPKIKVSCVENLSTERKDVSKVSCPPPGLDISGFGPPTPWASSASRTSVYYERVLAAEDWFHQGNNLQNDLPVEFAQRLNHELSKEKGVAGQTCDAFKRVMANLYSYSRTFKNGERTCKSLGFANLGPVSESCCEPRYGGRRSLFDNDPCARQWRLQTTRFTPDFILSAQRQSMAKDLGRPSFSLP